MDSKAFVSAVLSWLPDLAPEDREFEETHIARLQSQGYTVEDAVEYLTYTEEFGCKLKEEIALERMAKVRARVELRALV